MAVQRIKWSAPTGVQTLITTDLDSKLTQDPACSAVYDNSTAKDTHADFEFGVCYAAVPNSLDVALLAVGPEVDGTNAPEGFVTQSGTTIIYTQRLLSPMYLFQSVNASTSVVERLVLRGVPIPPGKFKVLIWNTSDTTYKDSTVSKWLKMRPYQMQMG
jgi:hypothetical protein